MLLLFWSGLTQGTFIWSGPSPLRTVRVEMETRLARVV